MKKNSFYLKSDCDNLDIYVTIFEPEKKTKKGIFQISHGMVEHQIYYYDLMKYLCDKGYVCVINDHRGHGKSVKSDKDLGFFYEEKADYVVEDLYQITKYVKDKYKDLDVYLFGHSMGSLIVRKYIKKYDKDIKKLIVCGSPSINKMSGCGNFICKLFRVVKGDHYRSKFLNKLALPNDPTASWLSINKDYIKEYRKDKYCSFVFTTNGFINLTQLMIDVYSKKGWELKNKKLPIYFIAGSSDMVIKSEKLWLKSIDFLENVGYKNIDFKLYPGLKHAIFKDNSKGVFKDILDFIKE